MILKFFKTNWFQVSLALIVLTAIAQRTTILSRASNTLPHREQKTAPLEKYTAATAAAASEGAVQMGIGTSTPRPALHLPPLDDATSLAFLRRFSNVAVGEHKKYGIPASVLLACAYVNSFAGQRPLVLEANNFFALACSPTWDGRTHSLNGHCFRRYDRAWDSFRDFSLYLTRQSGFDSLRKTAGSDWRKWAAGLAVQDVSDVADFEAEVKKAVESYRLFELDGN